MTVKNKGNTPPHPGTTCQKYLKFTNELKSNYIQSLWEKSFPMLTFSFELFDDFSETQSQALSVIPPDRMYGDALQEPSDVRQQSYWIPKL